MIIKSRAPNRIEFAGDGTDIPDYYKKYGGLIINATINKYAYVTIKELPKDSGIKILIQNKSSMEFPNLKSIKYEGDYNQAKATLKKNNITDKEIFLRNDTLPNSGLGTNAAIGTAILGAIQKLRKEEINKEKIAEDSYQISSIELGIFAGKQNHYASAHGGINCIELNEQETKVTKLNISKATLRELEKHLVLVYLGKRKKIVNNNHKKDKPLENNKEMLDKLKSLAIDTKNALENGYVSKLGLLMDKTWQIKKILNPGITNEYINHIYEIAKKNGALGGKINGSGNGGHMLFYSEENKEPQLVKALQENGAIVIDFSFDHEGVDVWEPKNDNQF